MQRFFFFLKEEAGLYPYAFFLFFPLRYGGVTSSGFGTLYMYMYLLGVRGCMCPSSRQDPSLVSCLFTQ